MVDAGVDGLTIYQETYDRDLYAEMHPFGNKRDYDFRLLTPERGGEAGLRRIGLGFLLGLGPFRREAFFLGLQALHMSRHFWRSQVSVSFPRIRPADGGFQPLHPVSDHDFVQLICALRLLLPDAGLVMSTRESAAAARQPVAARYYPDERRLLHRAGRLRRRGPQHRAVRH